MHIDLKEAQEDLRLTQQAHVRTQASIAATTGASFQLIWGFVWLVGALSSQWIPEVSGWVWAVGIALGSVVSALVGMRQGEQVRSASGPQVGGFFAALFGYTIVILLIVQPLDGQQTILFFLLTIMFGCVSTGIWLRVLPLTLYGLAVSTLAVIGYLVFPAYFWLWLAALMGLFPIVTGLVLLWRGRRYE